MPLKSLKDKIVNVAGGEILGDADIKKEEAPVVKPKQKKKRKTKEKSKKIIKNKTKDKKTKEITTKRKSNLFNQDKEEEEDNLVENDSLESKEEEEDKSQDINTVRDSVDGYEDVLSILGIKEKLEIDADFTSDELDYVEFTQTQPIGFDFDEVTDFISRTKYTMHKLESALRQRERDVVKVASQVKKVEQKMVEANQDRELERMSGVMTEEERLIEENMELKVTINELNKKLKANFGNMDDIKGLQRKLELAQAENEMLKMSGPKKVSKLPSKLPAFDDNNSDKDDNDPFSGMLDDIGGLYNENE